MCPKLPYLVKQTCFLKITFGGIFQSDFVISIYIGMFKTARNHPKKYHLCQKPAKSGSARILKWMLTSPSLGHLCNLGHNGFQNSGKLLIKWKPSRGRCPTIFDATEYSTVKLNILGNVICLTRLMNWMIKIINHHQNFAPNISSNIVIYT